MTTLSKEEALRVIEGRCATEQEARVEGFLRAIQEVPSGALRLLGIFQEALVFDFVGGEQSQRLLSDLLELPHQPDTS